MGKSLKGKGKKKRISNLNEEEVNEGKNSKKEEEKVNTSSST